MRSAGLPLTVGYTGHRWDPAIGQYFAPFRYYNPQTARWNMRDPLDMISGVNMYAYQPGNPTGFKDALGLFCWPCLGDALVNPGVPIAAWMIGTGLLLAAAAPATAVLSLTGAALVIGGAAAIVLADVYITFGDSVTKAKGAGLDVVRNHYGGQYPVHPTHPRNQQSKRCGSSPPSGDRGIIARAPGSPIPDGAGT
jgi:RHS repeat-associated protein